MQIDLIPDELCISLSRYLAEKINSDFLVEFPQYVSSDIKIVKSIRAYDDPAVPLDQFPLLKVYRSLDLYDKRNHKFLTTMVNVNYSCSFNDLKNLAGLMAYVSKRLVKGLHTYSMDIKHDLPPDFANGIQVQHATGMNEIVRSVYPFINLSLNIKDDCNHT
jgi:hypothetical protein